MSWNYRVVRYQANSETLVGLMEVFYGEDGTPNSYGLASVLHWESVDELRGTLQLMLKALDAPEIAVDGDVAQHIIDSENEREDDESESR